MAYSEFYFARSGPTVSTRHWKNNHLFGAVPEVIPGIFSVLF